MEKKNMICSEVDKKNREYYVKLRSMNPFRSTYAYLDTLDNNAGSLLRAARIKLKVEDGFVDLATGFLQIGIVSFPKRQEESFIECIKRHKKNSYIFGWGGTADCDRVLDDMYSAASQ